MAKLRISRAVLTQLLFSGARPDAEIIGLEMDGDVVTFVLQGRDIPAAEYVNIVYHLDPRSDDGSMCLSLEPVRD